MSCCTSLIDGAYGWSAAASKKFLMLGTAYMPLRKSGAFMSPWNGIPASTIWAFGSLLLIASWEIWSRWAYLPGEGLGAKNFCRLGSFQICQAWIGSGLALAPNCWW